ncbi:MAG: hypothetical protein ABSF23_05940 [Terracidiphilus sp.]|jgi:predicted ATP-grasp superfamily ATP-dependent carboligase
MHRILISEGSSLSARQIITALGMAGYRVGVCDPNPRCLGRFSRYVTQYYRSPVAGREPERYFDFVAGVLRRDHWDVLLPAHEQAFLFSREKSRIPTTAAIALAEFLSFVQVQGKPALTRTLARLGLPQPTSHIVRTQAELLAESCFPFYLKADYGTASTAVWCIRDDGELQTRVAELAEGGLIDGVRGFVVQEPVEGPQERVQAVFDRGRLVACQAYRQALAGPGGGDIAKLQVERPAIRQCVEKLGEALAWSGALSLDYILRGKEETPVFIDANPRLVEPMNAVFSGLNLAEILVRVSLGEEVKGAKSSRSGVRTHMLLMALLAAAEKRSSRFDVLAELVRVLTGRGVYRGSREELLPLGIDFKCLFPLAHVLIRLLLRPASAVLIRESTIAAYSLSPSVAAKVARG